MDEKVKHTHSKPIIKIKDSPREKRDSKVTWDVKQLEELEQYKLDNPVLMKINEPKTPYAVYEVIILTQINILNLYATYSNNITYKLNNQ